MVTRAPKTPGHKRPPIKKGTTTGSIQQAGTNLTPAPASAPKPKPQGSPGS